MRAVGLFRLWCGLALLAAALIPLSMVFLDTAVAGFSTRVVPAHVLASYALSSKNIGEIFLAAAAPSLLFCVFVRRFPPWAEALLLSAFAVAVSYYVVEHYLKPLFWHPDLRLPMDRLRYLTGWQGRSSSGFPSAHAALAAAALTVAALFWTRARALFVLGLIMADAVLIVGRWHYVSDVLAGNMLGVTMAVFTVEAASAAKAWRSQRAG
jgi:membrane-associated phospholipid phosphatase